MDNNNLFPDVSEEYKNLVDEASDKNEDFFINNSTIEHAMYLTYSLIKKARKNIKLYTGSLLEAFYDDNRVVNLLNEKINEGVKVEVITEKSPKAVKCLDLFKKNDFSAKIMKLKNGNKSENHFLLVDEQSFRLELPHNPADSNRTDFKIMGRANFNNKRIGNLLDKVFKELELNSVIVD